MLNQNFGLVESKFIQIKLKAPQKYTPILRRGAGGEVDMLKIGITGGIGSGKSTVCRVFELLGIPVYSADDEAKKILDANPTVKEQLLLLFGMGILDERKLIDRKKLAALVFDNKEKLQQLNNIVHPAVGLHFEKWLDANSNAPYIIKEAAILFESGAYKAVDKVITVTAPVELKIERVMQRDKASRQQVEQRMANQLSDEDKIKRSDFVIYNDEQQLVIPQVLSLNQELRELGLRIKD